MTLTPMLTVASAERALAFYREAFGAAEQERWVDPSGRVVARLAVEGQPFFVVDENREALNDSPGSLGGTTVRLNLVVDDPDAVAARAIASGAREIFPVADQPYGLRQGRVADPDGHHWLLGRPLAEAPRPAVPEAELADAGAGLLPASTGWFVLNARDTRWFAKPGQGHSVSLTGCDEFEAETYFPMLGLAIRVVGPGEPTTTYHWETEQEAFLVLAGDGVLIVEGEERPLRQWDFVHCPPGTRHAFAGAGDEPLVLLCASSRQYQKDGPWGFYCPDPVAERYNAASPEETQDGSVAYARFAPSRAIRYPGGLLPED